MKKIYLCLFALFAILSPHFYRIAPTPTSDINALPDAVSAQQTANGTLSTTTVHNYVASEAKKAEIDPIKALWIVQHESQLGQRLVGDDGDSLGYWMIDGKYHPEVSRTCAMDLRCSTAWSLPLVKENPNIWSTFACKYVWFYKEAVATFGLPPKGYIAPNYCGKPL